MTFSRQLSAKVKVIENAHDINMQTSTKTNALKRAVVVFNSNYSTK